MQDHRLIGISASIRDLEERIEAAARSDSKVLITGESGSGKEVAARLIHANSTRRLRQLVTINCAGFPDTLLESELFGHARGGFTGADRDRAGLLETAHGGTLFMDELGEMSLRMQAVLLRFLETGEIQRVGSDRPGSVVNVRLIAATNRDLGDAVRQKQFREDLHFRLNVIHIPIPPLREHREDIPMLIDWFCRAYSQRYAVPMLEIAPEAMERLLAHDWPGNVRELKNVVERLVVVQSGVVTMADLPPELVPAPAAAPVTAEPERSTIDDMLLRIVRGGESFWKVVYEPFMARDLTREDLRNLVRRGFEHAKGDHADLGRLFNVEGHEYKRFLNFVRRHGGAATLRTRHMGSARWLASRA
jgi:transcriptional regulator with PAS, ATPase and Fis domain